MDRDTIAGDTGPEPELRRSQSEPRGVLQRNLKTLVYLGAAGLVVVAAVFSSTGKKTHGTSGQPPQPLVQDNTDNNMQDLRNQIQAEQQKQQPRPAYPNPDYAPGGRYFGCVPGQACTPEMQQQNPQQLTPEQRQEQQLAANERDLAYNSRFASNIAFSRPDDLARGQGVTSAGTSQQQVVVDANSNLVSPHEGRDRADEGKMPKRGLEVNLDSAVGQPYVLYEGTTLDTILMNRLNGDSAGPVKVLVSNSVYSHDHQHVIVPDKDRRSRIWPSTPHGRCLSPDDYARRL
jgi:type IV secretory pathway VirB10-like protein